MDQRPSASKPLPPLIATQNRFSERSPRQSHHRKTCSEATEAVIVQNIEILLPRFCLKSLSHPSSIGHPLGVVLNARVHGLAIVNSQPT